MTFHAKVQARFEELIDAGEKIKATKQLLDKGTSRDFVIPEAYVDEEKAHQWTMSVLTIMKAALGDNNDGYERVKENVQKCALYSNFCIIQACVKAALEDLKGGYFLEAKSLLEAEVFSDLLEQAEELQRAGYKDAAAVLTGGVLEKQLLVNVRSPGNWVAQDQWQAQDDKRNERRAGKGRSLQCPQEKDGHGLGRPAQ